MAATVAYTSQGTALQVSISSVFTVIPQAKGITGPSINWDIEDTTNLSSPLGFHEKFPTAKQPGPVSFELVYDSANATHEYLRASNAATVPVLELFKEVTSAAVPKTWSFSGYVTKFEPDHQSLKVAMVKVEITPTGAVTVV